MVPQVLHYLVREVDVVPDLHDSVDDPLHRLEVRLQLLQLRVAVLQRVQHPRLRRDEVTWNASRLYLLITDDSDETEHISHGN